MWIPVMLLMVMLLILSTRSNVSRVLLCSPG